MVYCAEVQQSVTELKRPQKRHRRIAWAKIKAQYVQSSATIQALAAEYDVSASALQKRCAVEHWPQLRAIAGAETEAALRERAVQQHVETLADWDERHLRNLRAAEALVQRLLSGIVQEVQSDPAALRDEANLKRLDRAVRSLQAIVQTERAVHGRPSVVEEHVIPGVNPEVETIRARLAGRLALLLEQPIGSA